LARLAKVHSVIRAGTRAFLEANAYGLIG
jgi:hypothetical protein